MNPVAKLAGFAAVLALAFGTAAFAGSRIDVHPGTETAKKPDAHGMGAEEEGGHGGDSDDPQAVRGLAVSNA